MLKIYKDSLNGYEEHCIEKGYLVEIAAKDTLNGKWKLLSYLRAGKEDWVSRISGHIHESQIIYCEEMLYK